MTLNIHHSSRQFPQVQLLSVELNIKANDTLTYVVSVSTNYTRSYCPSGSMRAEKCLIESFSFSPNWSGIHFHSKLDDNFDKFPKIEDFSINIIIFGLHLSNYPIMYASQIQQSAKSFLILRFSLTQRSICFNFYSRRDSFQFFSYALVMISWKKLQNMQFDWKSSWFLT